MENVSDQKLWTDALIVDVKFTAHVVRVLVLLDSRHRPHDGLFHITSLCVCVCVFVQ